MKMILVLFVASLGIFPLFASASPNFAISCNVYEGTTFISDANKISDWEPLGMYGASYTWMRGQVFTTASGEYSAVAEVSDSFSNNTLELTICKGSHPSGMCGNDEVLAHMSLNILRGREVRIGSPEANLTLLCLAEQ